jgi:hypothetical protein
MSELAIHLGLTRLINLNIGGPVDRKMSGAIAATDLDVVFPLRLLKGHGVHYGTVLLPR